MINSNMINFVRNSIICLFLLFSIRSNADVYLNGQINTYNTIQLINNIDAKNQALPFYRPLFIYVNSSGGVILESFKIIHKINQVKKKRKVYIVVKDKCYSACFTILQSADVRIMSKNSKLMQHAPRVYTMVKITINGFNSNKLRKKEADIKKRILYMKSIMENIELQRLNISRKDWRKLTLRKDYYMDYKRALEINAIDKIKE